MLITIIEERIKQSELDATEWDEELTDPSA